jgi:hypothetical protein
MKTAAVLAALAVALVLQTTLAGMSMTGGTRVNLVLVAVVYLALSYGAVTGLLAGTVGGLAQDAIAGGVVGMREAVGVEPQHPADGRAVARPATRVPRLAQELDLVPIGPTVGAAAVGVTLRSSQAAQAPVPPHDRSASSRSNSSCGESEL